MRATMATMCLLLSAQTCRGSVECYITFIHRLSSVSPDASDKSVRKQMDLPRRSPVKNSSHCRPASPCGARTESCKRTITIGVAWRSTERVRH